MGGTNNRRRVEYYLRIVAVTQDMDTQKLTNNDES